MWITPQKTRNRHFLANAKAEKKQKTERFALPTAVSRCLELEFGLKACCFATVWQKHDFKIKAKGSK